MTSRIQLALNVRDVESATLFYADLFGVPPAKQRPGYANFVVADPPLKLVSGSLAGAVHGIRGAGMSCARPPLIACSDAEALARELAELRRGYVPEWTAPRGGGDAGSALDDIMARYLAIQAEGLNAMPQRLQLEFLESLGANVLPPEPARAPLVFTLLATASGDATVPAGTRVAAVLPPPAPSPLFVPLFPPPPPPPPRASPPPPHSPFLDPLPSVPPRAGFCPWFVCLLGGGRFPPPP